MTTNANAAMDAQVELPATIGEICKAIETPRTLDIFNEEDANGASRKRTEPQGAIVVVDPMSTGANLALEAASRRGLPVVCVWSDVCPKELRSFVACDDVKWAGEVHHEAGGIKATCAALQSIGDIAEVIVGSEPGIELADELAAALKLRGNSTAQSATRRNKFLQSEACRTKSLAVGAQAVVTSGTEVEAFLASQTWPVPFKAVVKPVDGAASQGVTVCNSPDEVRAAFGALQGTTNVLGLSNSAVLLMEYLAGDEYVVDTVSRDGEHKCALCHTDRPTRDLVPQSDCASGSMHTPRHRTAGVLQCGSTSRVGSTAPTTCTTACACCTPTRSRTCAA